MKIDRRGQEFAHFPVTGAPADAAAPEASFDGGATWAPMTWGADRASARVLVAGPSMPSPTGVVLRLGRNVPLVRLVDANETLIRSTGSIDVV